MDLVALHLQLVNKLYNVQQIIDRWKKVLLHAYNMPKYVDITNDQLFQKQINLDDFFIILHFSRNKLQSLSNHAFYEALELNEFKNIDFHYMPNEFAYKDLTKEEPIFIIPLPSDNKYGLVVDGNHRLSAAINSNYMEIGVLKFPVIATVQAMIDVFEQAYFVMQYELDELAACNNAIIPPENSQVVWFESRFESMRFSNNSSNNL